MYNNGQIQTGDITLSDIIKAYKGSQEYETRFRNVVGFLERELTLDFSHIAGDPYLSSTLGPVLNQINHVLSVHTKEILYLHRLIALLIFELVEQGIEPESKELINELEIYLKK